MQLQLPEYRLATSSSVPAWLPDETLFSWASRYHALSGNKLSSYTCLALFGHAQQGTQHDFPTRIDHLASATGGFLGDSDSIILGRTILPFFLHFIGESRAHAAICTLRGKQLGGFKFQLGLVTSRFRANHPLKACPTCLALDEETHGIPYWHLAHQYPGVWVCPIHQKPLFESTLKSTGVGRFLWHLPNEQTLRQVMLAADGNSENVLDALSAFAKLSIALSQLPLSIQLDSNRLHATYQDAMLKRGLTTSTKRLRLEAICENYRESMRALSVIPELAELFSAASTVEGRLGSLLRMPRSGTHPLRHLAIIYWLFSDWPTFWKSYQLDGVRESPKGQAKQSQKESRLHLRADFTACLNDGNSVTHCAKRFGISVNTGMAWAIDQGTAVRRRPKTITDTILNSVANDLRNGCEKQDLMTRYALSAASINRILRSVDGLHVEWLNAKFGELLVQNRSIWGNAISELPGEGLKMLRSKHPAAYIWLYRNDRQWLDSTLASLPKTNRSAPRAAVDWVSRDTVLAAKVHELVYRLQSRNGALTDTKCPIALWEIYQQIPELKAKLSALKKLPRTKQAIYKAIQRPQQGALFLWK